VGGKNRTTYFSKDSAHYPYFVNRCENLTARVAILSSGAGCFLVKVKAEFMLPNWQHKKL